MNDNKLKQFEVELKSRIAALVSLQQQQIADRPRKLQEIKHLAQETQKKIDEDLANHVSQQTKLLRNCIDNLKSEISKNFFVGNTKRLNDYNFDAVLSYDENVQGLQTALESLVALCAEVNALDFDEIDPPRVYTEENIFDTTIPDDVDKRDEVLKKVQSQYPLQMLKLCYEIHARLDRLEVIFSKEMNFGGYKTEVPSLEKKLSQEFLEKENARWRKAVKDQLMTDTASFSYDIFHELDDWRQQTAPDIENGSVAFKSEICVGDVYTSIIRKSSPELDKAIIAECNELSRHEKDGYLISPFVVDLKTTPHIFINVPGDEVSNQTIDFVHEYIQTMLMCQPSGRVNLCLVDFNDQCKFNRYAMLKKLNPNALLRGIVRNERDIESVLNDLETTMFDISDNKLSFSGVSNVFEYNDASPENPQNLHVMVLLDFPEKYSPDCINHIAKIMSNGADCGIYTVIVNNTEAQLDYGSRQQVVDNAIQQIKKNCVILHEAAGNNYVFASSLSRRNTSYPTKLVPSRICVDQAFGTTLYSIMEKNAKAQIDKVIRLEPFFELSRQYRAVDTKENDFSRLLEIPIGKNGGEVQCLRFFTDSGNAHALVIGGTGSGKSNLLHTIIISACYRYSPDELQIYLVDFKGGVEFKFYQANKVVADQLPHIRLTGLTSEPEDGVAILTNIRRILRERENTFRRHDVEDIIAYNAQREAGQKMPRMLIIIDEVQELMTNQRLAEQALDILGELFKKGRAFGISILWASQTVPKGVPGFKDKVLSQISNRICLKVNNSDDAADLGFDEKKIRLLNRPEKGVGVIFDGMDEIDFRVAYAENRENRRKYVHEINKRWATSHKTPLFIVGDDEVPNAAEGDTIFNRKPVQQPKSNDKYNAYLGQNYITGAPYLVPFASRGSGEHCWIAGKDIEAVRDVIGYSLLSMLLEHETNKDVVYNEPVKYYVFNGELMNDNRDLYCVLPDKFPRLVKKVDVSNITDIMVDLYRIRKKRAASPATSHTPIYFFIHQFQQLAELLSNTTNKFAVQTGTGSVETVAKTTVPKTDGLVTAGLSAPNFASLAPSSSTASGENLTFAQIFNELLHYGSEAGIHFIMTLNNPAAIPEVKTEMTKFAHKIVLSGVSNDSVVSMIDIRYMRDAVPTKEGVAFHYTSAELTKFKPYRYDPDDMDQENWLNTMLQFD